MCRLSLNCSSYINTFAQTKEQYLMTVKDLPASTGRLEKETELNELLFE